MLHAKALRACFIGAGNRALEHADIMATQVGRVEMVGVQDPSCSTNTDVWCGKHRLPMYSELDRMLEELRPDFAVICAPHDQHLDIVRQLGLHGVHAFKEKPLARNIAEGRQMLGLVEETGITLSITMQRRFLSPYARLAVEVPKLRDPRRFRGEYTIVTSEPAGGWRGSRARAGGGCLLDMGYHKIDLVLWCFGLPDVVTANYDDPRHEDDVENEATVSLGYECGLTGELFISRCGREKREFLTVSGADETLTAERAQLRRSRNDVPDSGEVLESGGSSWAPAMVAQLNHFVEVLAGREANRAAARSHLEHMAFVEACYRSKAEGCPVNPKSLI